MTFLGTAHARRFATQTIDPTAGRMAKAHEQAMLAADAAERLVAVLSSPSATPLDVAEAARASSRASDALFTAASWAAETE